MDGAQVQLSVAHLGLAGRARLLSQGIPVLCKFLGLVVLEAKAIGHFAAPMTQMIVSCPEHGITAAATLVSTLCAHKCPLVDGTAIEIAVAFVLCTGWALIGVVFYFDGLLQLVRIHRAWIATATLVGKLEPRYPPAGLPLWQTLRINHPRHTISTGVCSRIAIQDFLGTSVGLIAILELVLGFWSNLFLSPLVVSDHGNGIFDIGAGCNVPKRIGSRVTVSAGILKSFIGKFLHLLRSIGGISNRGKNRQLQNRPTRFGAIKVVGTRLCEGLVDGIHPIDAVSLLGYGCYWQQLNPNR
mmetsp:Transcript_2937/g.6939  ORF Transcript_2937/g.6939 Transcript_2937/m.6939 type:complete len:299 (-) Transcript_2937:2538-3434(-)